ncbi:hypothetical protein R6I31_003118 [Vibrio cholerae]|uniref:hypothetical protein n=1 Tax=Vibrio cholerae TaxID=666 RepID=UPI0029515568|nr:hypothetical protein [Vibrio cholerae]EIA4706686.1 hypothetical protein [Vibrio cholerae]EIC9802737.1 hypothetical protein [Vibrio cholerae]EJL6261173.1 hypothetical protein [Vibrio cholerae]EJL6438766.1 hypothetical protein [Vibrio cholerae]EJL6883149.1 hypothetical protein [Vibrio cholerae]
MRLLFFPLIVLTFGVSASSNQIYLDCEGERYDRELQHSFGMVKNQLLLDKSDKTISLVITGIPTEETPGYKTPYFESPTQYQTEQGKIPMISINRHTLEYSVFLPFGNKISGNCKVKQPAI